MFSHLFTGSLGLDYLNLEVMLTQDENKLEFAG